MDSTQLLKQSTCLPSDHWDNQGFPWQQSPQYKDPSQQPPFAWEQDPAISSTCFTTVPKPPSWKLLIPNQWFSAPPNQFFAFLVHFTVHPSPLPEFTEEVIVVSSIIILSIWKSCKELQTLSSVTLSLSSAILSTFFTPFSLSFYVRMSLSLSLSLPFCWSSLTHWAGHKS